jgi:glutamate dehydrogenase (NAD(P)+)
MVEVFAATDEIGPIKVVHVSESRLGLKGTLVIDNVARGPAIGGLRMAPDVSVEECARLARAMTLKSSAAGLAHGGGKSVLWGDPQMPLDKKAELIRGFAHALRNETDYIFGPDMGTDETCMAWIKDEIGRAAGLPACLGGIPLDELGATGWGLLHSTLAGAHFLNMTLDGARVAIQGFGAVGRHAAKFLVARGARLVAVSDSRGTLASADGIDLAELARLKDAGGSVCDYPGGRKSDVNAVIDIECELWIPAARPDVIREDNVHRLRTKLLVQGANIPCTMDAERILDGNGILVIPDFVANAGGLICAAMEYHGATQTAAFQAIEDKVRANTEAVLDESRRSGVAPREAATRIALEGVHAAMKTRRFASLG